MAFGNPRFIQIDCWTINWNRWTYLRTHTRTLGWGLAESCWKLFWLAVWQGFRIHRIFIVALSDASETIQRELQINQWYPGREPNNQRCPNNHNLTFTIASDRRSALISYMVPHMLHPCFGKGIVQQSMMTHLQTWQSPDSSTSKHQNRRKNSILPLQPGPCHVAAEGMEVTSCGTCWPGSLLLEVIGCTILLLIPILGYEKITPLLIRWTWIAFFCFVSFCFSLLVSNFTIRFEVVHLQLFGRMISFPRWPFARL